jgi:diguanylate cyclase (GGDEF)-like protein
MLTQEVERAARFNHPLSFLFLDLDRFKEINDSYGHLVGSTLLAEVGLLLMGCIRKVDSAFRYGGDEFAIILVETALPGAVTAGQRIRERFSRKVFLQEHGLSVQMTASIGVATFPEHASNASDLLHAADQAMYRAKARGRNDVVVAGPPGTTPP